jgi:hypothetical protein
MHYFKGDASVSSCIMTNNGAQFDCENSYNSGTHNKLVSNVSLKLEGRKVSLKIPKE